MECKSEGKIVKYIEETGRSMKERRVNYEEDARSKKKQGEIPHGMPQKREAPGRRDNKLEIQSYKKDTFSYVQVNC